jgi:hypothetical protein
MPAEIPHEALVARAIADGTYDPEGGNCLTGTLETMLEEREALGDDH